MLKKIFASLVFSFALTLCLGADIVNTNQNYSTQVAYAAARPSNYSFLKQKIAEANKLYTHCEWGEIVFENPRDCEACANILLDEDLTEELCLIPRSENENVVRYRITPSGGLI